jgi:hypothetical protein
MANRVEGLIGKVDEEEEEEEEEDTVSGLSREHPL